MFWLLACLSSDASLHRSALKSGLAADCSRIRSDDLQGDCLSWQAVVLERAGEASKAEALCGEIRAPMWQGECWFLISDSRSATEEEALRLCEGAAPFRQQCMDHAIQRLAEQLMRSPGQEMQAVAELTEAWGEDYSPQDAEFRSRAMVAGLMAIRERPMTRASLGNADQDLVTQALSLNIKSSNCTTVGLDARSLERELERTLALHSLESCKAKRRSGQVGPKSMPGPSPDSPRSRRPGHPE